MKASITYNLRHMNGFMRLTACVVLAAFTLLVLEPLGIAVGLWKHDVMAATTTTVSDETQMSKALQKINASFNRMADKLDKAQDVSSDKSELASLRDQITTLDSSVMAHFAEIGAMLKAKNLPAVILKRQADAVAKYKTQYKSLLKTIKAIETASTLDDLKANVQKGRDQLKAHKNSRSQQPFDPNNLPNRSLKPNPNNKPKTTVAAYSLEGDYSNPTIKVAALGDFTFDKLPGASDPAYLAATTEVTLSDDIKAKAQELNYDPVKIYHWVRNNIQWQPAWGAMQDADLTLSSGRGNAMDISSLLIALLRASKIPARYVHGTIEVPEGKFRNWVGGFDNIQPAIDYASSGGIPITGIVEGGKITRVRMEHIWVEAAIDYQPSRGAKNKDADSWVAMDPSYKQYTFKKGLDVLSVSGIDSKSLLQNFIDSGTVNADEGWISGLDTTNLQNTIGTIQTKVNDYIANNMTNPTVGDVLGGQQVIIKDYPALPSSLANRIVAVGATYSQLPNSLEHEITLALGKGALGELINTVTYPWAELNNKKITLSFKPATTDDATALESLLPDGDITDFSQLPSSIPSYLIQVIPELKVNDKIVKQGNSMYLGEELPFVYQLTYRGYGTSNYSYNVIAGSYLSIAVVGGSVSSKIVGDIVSNVDKTNSILQSGNVDEIANISKDAILGDMYYAGALGYYAQLDSISNIIGRSINAYSYLAAGYGSFGYEPNVNYLFGIPTAITEGGSVMNMPMKRIIGIDSTDTTKRATFNYQIGLLSSTLENVIPERIFTTDPTQPVEAISAVKALSIANEAGQKTYYITASNEASVLPLIHHDANTMREISDALAVGKNIITHTDDVAVPSWSGAGYIIVDPVTGDGAFKIGGGQNGSFLQKLSDKLDHFIQWMSALNDKIGKLKYLGKTFRKIFGQVLRFAKNLKAIIDLQLACSGWSGVADVFSYIFIALALGGISSAIILGAVAGCGFLGFFPPLAFACVYIGVPILSYYLSEAYNSALEFTKNQILESCKK